MPNQLTPEQKDVLSKIKFPVMYYPKQLELRDDEGIILLDLFSCDSEADVDTLGHMIADSFNKEWMEKK